MKIITSLTFCLLALTWTALAETYHTVKLSNLDFGNQAEEASKALTHESFSWGIRQQVNIRSTTECYCGSIPHDQQRAANTTQGEFELVFRIDDQKAVSGFVDMLMPNADGMAPTLKGFAFTFKPTDETLSTKEHFNKIRASYATSLANDHLPGSAWFQFLAGPVQPENEVNNWRNTELSDTFAIFSGGRAISENLAMDRDLILANDKDGKTVPLSEIVGVTVKAIDWSSKMPKDEVKVDSLSLSIPEDQHALFAKSLPDLLALIDRTEKELIPSAQAYSVRNPFRQLATRYKKQMGLDVADVAARLLPAKNVAVTGGDPFFPLGSDIAFVIESDSPELLYKALLTVIESKASTAGATAKNSSGADFEYQSFETTNRSFSSHLWRMGNVVAVANSSAQIENLTAVAQKKKAALGSTDEFRYFRNRYPIDNAESVFIFLSDATIRRWAGPEIRIAASRRTRAIAALGELTSQALAGEKITDIYKPLLGETTWKDGQIYSANFGTMNFMTPAAELKIDTVTIPERDAYIRWRDGYENGWAQAFDPIAIRILSKKDGYDMDLSVIPLTVDSDYAQFIRLCGNAELSKMARWVPEESDLHFALAIDTKGEEFKEYNSSVSDFLPGLEVNPLSWMSGSISIDLEKSLFWRATDHDGFDRFMQTPILARIGSNSRLKLALFITALRKELNTSAPDSVTWETRTCDAGSYVAISGNEVEIGQDARLYYATLPNALLISLREDVLIRAMRRETHTLNSEETKILPPATQLMLDSSPSFLSNITSIFDSEDPMLRLREESWKALPILNEWHRRFPGKDSINTHILHFNEDIYCPGGRGYRWNDAAHTMESIAFGFPAEPRTEPLLPPGIMSYDNVRTSLRFEDSGLRATITIGEKPKNPLTPQGEKVEPVLLAKASELIPAKEGMTLTYKGVSEGAPVSFETTIKNLIRKEDKTTYAEDTTWVQGEEEPIISKSNYTLDKGLFLNSVTYDEGTTNYIIPELNLPENLIAGSVTRSKSAGTHEWEEEGKKMQQKFHSEYELRVIGKEDLELPAGTFKGCVRVEWAHQELIDGFFTGTKFVSWYHPGTGLVKVNYIEGKNTSSELEKISMPEEQE